MQFEHSSKTKALIEKVDNFLQLNLYPVEKELQESIDNAENRWSVPPLLEDLKARAKAEGLWNFFLPESEHVDNNEHKGFGLTNLEYAPLCELMGRSRFAGEIFNCSAPDTGNMEVLARYGTEAHKEAYLKPLLEGSIRSAFAMTEPAVASSDATNIQTSIVRDGNEYLINGHKWYISGACDPRCEIMIVMGKTDPDLSLIHI